MDFIQDVYHLYPGLCNLVIGLLVFGGLARIAFWRDLDGLRVGGPLVIGLALLLTFALLAWAEEQGRRIQELGPFAVFILLEAVILLAVNARRKAHRL